MNTLISMLIVSVLFVVVVIVVVVVLLTTKRRSSIESIKGEEIPWPLGINANFLSAAEQSFYGVLTHFVGEHYVVCPKVNLSDIIFIRNGTDNSIRQSLFNRISRKHLDFVLLDPKTLVPALAIELDDNSHQAPNVQERDAVKDKALHDAGLKLIRIPVKHAYTLNDLRDAFPKDIHMENNISNASIDGKLLETEIDTVQNKDEPTDNTQVPVCPVCKVEMIKRKASRGNHAGLYFWGCPNYPHCRETRQISEE